MVGITEQGDASVDFTWENKLGKVEFAILITKNITDEFIEKVLKHKNKLIIHCTVTGMGNSIYEPNVMNYDCSYDQICKLIYKGFPKEQLVLRIDPIIPTDDGINNAINVLNKFKTSGIKRVRYSYLDMYNHVVKRFKENNIDIPYNTFTAPYNMINECNKQIHKFDYFYIFESCAEYNNDQLGCISKKDYDILGIDFKIQDDFKQRKSCMCCNKKELLNNKHRCVNQCVYCYWRG